MARRALAVVLACALALAGCGGHHRTVRPATKRAVGPPAGSPQSAMGSVAPAGWGHPPAGALTLTPPAASSTPVATMLDTITTSVIPRGTAYLAGYVDGSWRTYNPLLALPWHPHVISIAVFLGDRAECGDFEPGDMSPSQAASFYFDEKRAGIAKPCEYSSYWEFVNQIRPALAAAHIARSSVWEWDADYTGAAHLDAGFDATQWTDRYGGLNLDASEATFAFLGIVPPKPKPARVICFGAHAARTVQCKQEQAKVRYDQGAAAASEKAHQATQANIVRLGHADATFLGRIAYFDRAASAILKAYS